MNMTDINNTENTEQYDEVKNPAAVLKKNKELLAKNAELTARIAELEGQLGDASTAQEKLQSEFADFHVRRPLARLAEEISPLSDVWMAEFSKHYDVNAVDGDELGIFHKDGKRCTVPKGSKGEGDPVKFTAKDIWWMLCRDNVGGAGTPESKRWDALMHWHGPSGSGAPGSSGSPAPAPAPQQPLNTPKKAFGIR